MEPLVELMGELRESIVYMGNTTYRWSCVGLDVLYDVFIARHAHPCVR
jgi:acyl carrier protein phosphodiesterase